MNIPDALDMGEIGIGGTSLKKGIMCKLHNKTDPGFPQEIVGDCVKVGWSSWKKIEVMEE